MGFKDYVSRRLKESNQFDYLPELEARLNRAKSFDDVKQVVDLLWGWEDSQTVYLLEGFIRENMD